MRILQLSDTHLGAQMNARGPRGWSRAADHHAALERALQPALREEVDLVLHCGDVFDRSRPPQRWVVEAGKLFAQVARRVPVIGIAGNHDRRGIQRWLPHASLGFTDRPRVVDQGGLRVGLIPFRRDPVHFRHDREQLGEVDLLAVHQGPDGCRVGSFQFRVGRPGETIGQAHLGNTRWVASGHIHPRQAVQVGGTTVVCGGSTERTSFSEAEETKGTVLWEFGSGVRWRFVEHATRPMNEGSEALVRCSEAEVEAVRRRGQIAVVRRDTTPHERTPRPDRRPVRLPLFGGVSA